MSRRALVLILSLVALAAGAAALSPPTGAQDVDKLRQRAASKRSSERSLSADVARLGHLLRTLQHDIAVVQRRHAEVRAELAQDQVRLDELRGALRERIAPYKVPRRIHFREALPHSAQGKVLRRALRDAATTS
jgi:acyl-CoA synthetase (AMP-forming)/AMP-acid ligase II